MVRVFFHAKGTQIIDKQGQKKTGKKTECKFSVEKPVKKKRVQFQKENQFGFFHFSHTSNYPSF